MSLFDFKGFREEAGKTMKLALPMILGQIGHIALNLVDTAMVGRVGVNPLAGVAFGGALFLVLIVAGSNLCTAVHILVARSTGAGKQQETAHILRHGLLVALLFGLPIAGFIHFKIDWLSLFRQSPEVIFYATDYTIYVTWSLIPVLIFTCFRNYSEAWGYSWLPFWVSILGVFLNVWLNWIFIFGNWGAPEMGAAGAGFATLLARIFITFVMIFYIIRSGKFVINWRLKDFFNYQLKYIKPIIKLGLPVSGQGLLGLGFLFVVAIMMGKLGANYLAAHQIAIQLYAFLFMVPLGLSFALSIRVGEAVGANNLTYARKIGLNGIALAVLLMAVCAIIMILMRGNAAWWFVTAEDPAASDVARIVSSLLIVAALFLIGDALGVNSSGSLRALSDVMLPALSMFICYWFIGFPVGYGLGFPLGYNGVGIWVGMAIAVSLNGVIMFFRFRAICRDS